MSDPTRWDIDSYLNDMEGYQDPAEYLIGGCNGWWEVNPDDASDAALCTLVSTLSRAGMDPEEAFDVAWDRIEGGCTTTWTGTELKFVFHDTPEDDDDTSILFTENGDVIFEPNETE